MLLGSAIRRTAHRRRRRTTPRHRMSLSACKMREASGATDERILVNNESAVASIGQDPRMYDILHLTGTIGLSGRCLYYNCKIVTLLRSEYFPVFACLQHNTVDRRPSSEDRALGCRTAECCVR
jgi:hypothetical protein